MALPLVRTINTPKSSSVIMMGNNQNFFLAFKKPQISFKKSILFLYLIKENLVLRARILY